MKYRIAWACVLCLAALPGWASSCSPTSQPQLPQPAWVTEASQVNDDKYYGIGANEIVNGDIPRAIEGARSRANSDLAQSIRVDVTSSIKSSESKLTENGKTATQSSIEAVTDSVARLSLQSVRLESQWVDALSCRLWLRVSVSRAEAQRAQRQEASTRMAASFEAQMKLAEQPGRPVSERERALAAAGEVLAVIDPALVLSFSIDSARIRLDAERSTVAEARRAFGAYAQQLARHLKANGQMMAATASGPRRVAAAEAMNSLQTMMGMAATGMPGLALPFEVDARMAQLFGELSTPCLAKKWFDEHGQPVPASLSSGITTCGTAGLAHERRQLYLIGRTIHLNCSIDLDGQPRGWEKACAAMQDKLVRDGAIMSNASASGSEPVHQVKLTATGSIKKRIDPDSQASLWRFEGTIATSFTGPDQIDVVDRYEGITGWNPVSASMTTDILALNVVARFDAAINKNWEK